MPRPTSPQPRPRPRPSRRPRPRNPSRAPTARDTIQIRTAGIGDAARLAVLSTSLGYPVTAQALAPRIRHLLASDHDRLLVATTPQNAVVGWIHAFLCQLIEAEFRAEIGGLIVDPTAQRRGIGRRLVEAIEDWARARGARELSVRCQIKRAEAHQFYTALGFGLTKTQHVFRRSL